MARNKEIIVGDLFPQPASGSRVFISVYSESPVHGEYHIINEYGEEEMTEVFDLVSEGDTLELDIHNLPSGTYSFEIKVDDLEWSRQIRIQKNQ